MRSTQALPQAPTPAAQAIDLTFAYGDHRAPSTLRQGSGQAGSGRALDALTLEVPAGVILGLLGPNGSGKSTLLSLLAGLRQPQSGSLRVLGQPPSATLRARVGLLFQETCLDPLMTARETLWLHGRLFALPTSVLRPRVADLLERFGLADRADRLTSTLSGGLKRRLELARALLPSPQLLLLDEPTTGLDPDSEQALWSQLHEINRAGAAIILATNRVQEADQHCDIVGFLHQGRLAAQGTSAQLKANLKHDAVWLDWPGFGPPFAQEIARWDGVGKLTWSPPVLHATVDSASAFVPRLFQIARDGIRAIRIREATLEDAYFDIVGASLDPQEEAK